MRGSSQSGYMQDCATVREYEQAKKLGAMGLAIGIRNANPHLTERFNETDDKLALQDAAYVEHHTGLVVNNEAAKQ